MQYWRDWFAANGRDLLIFSLALLVILIIFILMLGKFTTSADMVAVLGAVLPIISTIAAAAIGVSVGTTVGTKAGAKEGEAKAADAHQQMVNLKNTVQSHLDNLIPNMDSVHSQITAIQPIGVPIHAGNIGSHQIKVTQATLDEINRDVGAIQGALKTVP